MVINLFRRFYYFSHILKGQKAGNCISDLFDISSLVSFPISTEEIISMVKNRAGHYSNMQYFSLLFVTLHLPEAFLVESFLQHIIIDSSIHSI